MKYFHKTVLVYIIYFLSASVVCFAGTSIRTEHFEVFYEGLGKYYAEIASQSAERSFIKITETLGHKPSEKISIILTKNNEQFNQLTRDALPDWSIAAALPGNRIIISPLTGHKLSLERIIAHEIVHCIINDVTGEVFVPRWFHEGCAEVLSGRWGIRGRTYMVLKVIRGDILTFSEIQRIFSAGSADATLAYDQSMLAARHLMSLRRGDALREIITDLTNGVDFQTAFLNAVGYSVAEFEMEYNRRLNKAYGIRTVLTWLPGTWTVILMISVIVYIVKKKQNRRLLKHWEEIEKPGNVVDFKPFPQDE